MNSTTRDFSTDTGNDYRASLSTACRETFGQAKNKQRKDGYDLPKIEDYPSRSGEQETLNRRHPQHPQRTNNSKNPNTSKLISYST
ncbi:MAG: hypothetical protein AAGD22_03055 [Verrucomicrobiota bacterium]